MMGWEWEDKAAVFLMLLLFKTYHSTKKPTPVATADSVVSAPKKGKN